MEHLDHYLTGYNDFSYTNNTGELRVGVIDKIGNIVTTAGGQIISLEITLEWLVQIHEVQNTGNNLDSRSWQAILEHKQKNYTLQFKNPKVIKIRSPLTFSSDRETIEITHVTPLSKLVNDIRRQLPSL